MGITRLLSQSLFEGIEMSVSVLFVDLHLLDEVLLCLPAETVVLFTRLVENLLHTLALLSQLLQHEGLLGLQQELRAIWGGSHVREKKGWNKSKNRDYSSGTC